MKTTMLVCLFGMAAACSSGATMAEDERALVGTWDSPVFVRGVTSTNGDVVDARQRFVFDAAHAYQQHFLSTTSGDAVYSPGCTLSLRVDGTWSLRERGAERVLVLAPDHRVESTSGCLRAQDNTTDDLTVSARADTPYVLARDVLTLSYRDAETGAVSMFSYERM